MLTLQLADSYKRIGLKDKAFRVKYCSCELSFKVNYHTGERKLHSMKSCQVRLCSICNWRRSLKIFGQVSKVMDYALQEQEYRFIFFLTITCKNIEGHELSRQIDNLFYAFKKLVLKAKVKKAVKGWFRAYRLHIILMVNKSYFKKTDLYLSQEEWTSLWKDCLKVDYTPVVDVRAFKTGTKKQTAKSVAETVKYAVKDTDYLIENNKDLTDKTVLELDGALANRRLIAFGGELRKIHKLLNLDDPEDGDLVNTDNEEELRDDVKYSIEVYNWYIGYKQYIKNYF
ncbi:protein rep [Anaerobranca gottschalkii]|uniref:Plasmid rolling circle replication initiator protein REP and truncated derivatives n=1 Tax=Anaerobranca gottschalkii DSM 13577 TaxID=1120990 RepID=A0A1H9YQZ1_9FIRM|nr:protein rep [Anaerobranca gottschalkii]SES71510.1 Plasmid rolling circle replication initiator protein REP and truncated derivatives [Anaerobranca gottschalkii DSM 13577]